MALYKKGKQAVSFQRKQRNFLDEAVDHRQLFWQVLREELKYCGMHTVFLAVA